MESIYRRVEAWVKDRTARMAVSWPPQAPPGWRWPPWKDRQDRREQERRLREEYERQRRQLRDLCRAAKADSVADLQEIFCSMVLAECVYKRPAADMIRAINKFKGDFGGQLVSLEHVQPSLDHVLHRYLLAEAGDTLFASFIGTKQYKDVITDVNILQGAIFHEDDEDFEAMDVIESHIVDSQNNIDESLGNPTKATKKMSKIAKPAAHRGFLARAKGIPALEIYRLAQKKNRNLVLCGHSLGGAVAALATLSILRILSSSSTCKEHAKIQVKCITFSQPAVGNAALKDYVHQKGWQNYFKSYCIPEDLVPRILSPAYFHHYNSQTAQKTYDSAVDDRLIVKSDDNTKKLQIIKPKDTTEEQLVLGLGPVQTSFWRLSKLVRLEGMLRHLNALKSVGNEFRRSSLTDLSPTSTIDETEAEPQSLEIQEGCDGISLKPISDIKGVPLEGNSKLHGGTVDSSRWRKVPYLPSYVPFGQLYLLRDSLVELLSDSEYSKLTSMSSVIAELKERFQSHSMKSYRSRFQKIYERFVCVNAASFLGMDQLPMSPHLKQLLGLRAVGSVELGHIVDSPVIRTATSILPLGWSGIPGNKNGEPLKVDVIGHGLHLCTLVQARVNGNWCSTVVESLPAVPSYSSNLSIQPDLQKMRIVIGSPLKKPPKCHVEESLSPLFSYPVADCVSTSPENSFESSCERNSICEAVGDFVVYCTTDFTTVSKKVHVRVRRVRLLGFEGAGKTSLFKAVVNQSRNRKDMSFESVHAEVDVKEKIIDGLCYLDSEGVNLQELQSEAAKFREELQNGLNDLGKKIDLVVLVHNLSQRIPHCHQSINTSTIPALSLLLSEVKDHEIPWVLAITNKFCVDAHDQSMLVKSATEAYGAHPNMTQVINSRPFVVPSVSNSFESLNSADSSLTRRLGHHKLILAPFNLARRSLQRKEINFPIEGVTAFRQLVHQVLHDNEEMAFQVKSSCFTPIDHVVCKEELANERLSLELAREKETTAEESRVSHEKGSSITAAAVGGSLGAGLGLVMAVVMGAASALRKP
ncbi:hypothetical protein AXF42_Ash018420 [Apostasia shenzhenica]|uniref:Fungal lipase-type domain-containing protein n=1 Tax=Apostasia shenzhenica TaxID=1088818 RepID=A0A2I0BEA0_9ASPA|nr:hypothetical protein AXF42_Ash018420 [Apostasia shenzhenica]